MVPLEIAIFIFDVTSGLQGIGRFFGNLLLDFGISRPASRVQESEADYIGLMMMAKSCYDPNEAVRVWERMQTADKHNIPQWMSTHPSNSSRISKMTEWLPKAEQARSEGGCAVTLGYQKEFADLWGRQFDFFR
jgi:Zn-dependent protease with chaperone function